MEVSGIPSSAVSGGTLTSFALTQMQGFLATATFNACPTCSVKIDSVTNADTGARLYTASRQLQSIRLTVTASVATQSASTADSFVAAVGATGFLASANSALASAGYTGATFTSVSASTATTSASSSTTASSSSSLGAIVGGAVGGAVFLAAVGALVYCMCCRNAHPKEAPAAAPAATNITIMQMREAQPVQYPPPPPQHYAQQYVQQPQRHQGMGV